MSQPSLAILKQKRASSRAALTRVKTFIDTRESPLAEELECRLSLLEAYFKQYISIQDQIEIHDDATDADKDGVCDTEDLYCTTKAKVLALLENHRKHESFSLSFRQSDANTFAETSIPVHKSHLPKIKLPTFSGSCTEYINFIKSFEVAVSQDQSLSNIEKLLFLRSCLQGEALKTIDPLEIAHGNFDIAIKLLKERYGSTYILFQGHVSKMFDIPNVTRPSAVQLRRIVDNINAHLAALQSQGNSEQILHAILLQFVKKKLDVDTCAKWEESIDHGKLPTWDDFSKFINVRCQCLSASSNQPASQSMSREKPNNKFSLMASNSSCLKCQDSKRFIQNCPSILKLPIIDRFNEIKRLGLCINCLRKGHSVKACRSSLCRVCRLPHHSILHRFSAASEQATPPIKSNDPSTKCLSEEPSSSPDTVCLQSVNESSSEIILATALIYVKDHWGNPVPARALLDGGSQLNFVTEKFAQSLNVNRCRSAYQFWGICNTPTKTKFSTDLSIKSRVTNYETTLHCLIVPTITRIQPESEITINEWNIPANITLADPNFNLPQNVDVLIGCELFYHLLTVGQIVLGEKKPILQKTVFGWLVAGPFQQTNSYKRICGVALNEVESENENHQLLGQLEKFWSMEETINQPGEIPLETNKCDIHFRQTTTRSSDGRFIVRLPFKDPPSNLGNSYNAAYRSLLRLEKQLSKAPEIRQQYNQFMREYEELNHMTLHSNAIEEIKYFIPHRCVLRPQSSTTKLRVVFNASRPTSENTSLNDILMAGPVVQSELFDIIIKFRCHKYALTADISKMYRQILVAPEDQKYLAILWRENPTHNIKTYLLSTVTYGTTCAPFQATRCLLQLALEHENQYPVAAEVIKNDFYVDDMITGGETVEELRTMKHQVENILSAGQFVLRKWASNSKEMLATIPPELIEPTIALGDSELIKTLGIMWCPQTDQFQFTCTAKDMTNKCTKRGILASISSVFDPLGLLSPIVVVAKLIMQRLWSLKLAWDESVPMDVYTEWKGFCKQLPKMIELKIDRRIYVDSANIAQLHGFSDASLKAYGCCLYLRSANPVTGQVEIKLICSKSRVAPLKTQSLPRFELCAALLMAQLLHRVRSKLLHIQQIILWSDSQITLHWIKGIPSNWNIFVANRVSKIQSLTQQSWWHHVSSKNNPADLVSRGCTVTELVASHWLNGPEFLYQSPNTWPTDFSLSSSVEIPEKRKSKFVLVCQDKEIDVIAQHKFVNNYLKLCRIFAYVLKFIYRLILNIKSKNKIVNSTIAMPTQMSSELTSEDLHQASRRIIFIIQKQEFCEEIRSLHQSKPIKPSSSIKSLCPFLDSQVPSLIRVGGRLARSTLPYETKFPILLPRNHPFVLSYINYLHFKNLHAGTQSLVAASRQNFWIIGVKAIAKQVVRKCIHCFHYRPKTLQQLMGNLPPERVTSSHPFENSGVDFCGPFLTSTRIRGRPLQKSYIALFICFSTKAVHLEVVSALSTEAFMACLKRFVSRRGICKSLFCDNATNFADASSVLKGIYKTLFSEASMATLNQEFAKDMISFRFIPPRSPHFGGLWESAIKSAKHHLYRVMHEAALSYEELSTVATQIEAILNSRPLVTLSDDPNDEEFLTPGHFLIGRPLTSLPDQDYSTCKMTSLTHWQKLSAIRQHFWSRWSKEYVLQLQQRNKWSSQQRNLTENALVLVAEPSPPQSWILGKIIKTYPGTDGLVRVVDVKTKSGVLRRSIGKIAPLPLKD